MGNALYHLHHAFQAFASRVAWIRYQAGIRREREAARVRHGAIRDIEARQRATVNAALLAAVQTRRAA